MKKAVLVTGVNGGIGSEIARHFMQHDYAVFGTDIQSKPSVDLTHFWSLDVSKLVSAPHLQTDFRNDLRIQLETHETSLEALINNAAVQILGDISAVTMDDFMHSQSVNVAAPLLLSQLCLHHLKSSNGVIVNIGSIHAGLTKPGFISYATSKASIRGLTQALAVDLKGQVRVNCIEPAAIATDMLIDGFKDNPERLDELKACHPSGEIGMPEEVAELCHFLVQSKIHFLNGAHIGLNGGIAVRLHDPV